MNILLFWPSESVASKNQSVNLFSKLSQKIQSDQPNRSVQGERRTSQMIRVPFANFHCGDSIKFVGLLIASSNVQLVNKNDKSPVIKYIWSAIEWMYVLWLIVEWILRAHDLRGEQGFKFLSHHGYLHHSVVGIQIVLSMGFKNFCTMEWAFNRFRTQKGVIPGIEKLMGSKSMDIWILSNWKSLWTLGMSHLLGGRMFWDLRSSSIYFVRGQRAIQSQLQAR